LLLVFSIVVANEDVGGTHRDVGANTPYLLLQKIFVLGDPPVQIFGTKIARFIVY
jgi:hypothetical protein